MQGGGVIALAPANGQVVLFLAFQERHIHGVADIGPIRISLADVTKWRGFLCHETSYARRRISDQVNIDAQRKRPAAFAGRAFVSRSFRAGSGGFLQKILGQHVLGFVMFDLLDGRHFAYHPVERRFIQLALGIGLLGLVFRAVQVTHHFGD